MTHHLILHDLYRSDVVDRLWDEAVQLRKFLGIFVDYETVHLGHFWINILPGTANTHEKGKISLDAICSRSQHYQILIGRKRKHPFKDWRGYHYTQSVSTEISNDHSPLQKRFAAHRSPCTTLPSIHCSAHLDKLIARHHQLVLGIILQSTDTRCRLPLQAKVDLRLILITTVKLDTIRRSNTLGTLSHFYTSRSNASREDRCWIVTKVRNNSNSWQWRG